MSELKVYVKPLKTNMFGKTIVGQSYYLKSEADKVIARHKRKRCLAMAKWCECKRIDAANYRIPREKWEFYDKWQKRWLALAEEPTWAKFLQLIQKDEK